MGTVGLQRSTGRGRDRAVGRGDDRAGVVDLDAVGTEDDHTAGAGDVASGRGADDAAVLQLRIAVEAVGEAADGKGVIGLGNGTDVSGVGDASGVRTERDRAVAVTHATVSTRDGA